MITKRYNIDTTYDLITTSALTITAPGPGFVIVNGTVGVSIEGAGTTGFVRLRDTTTATGTASPIITTATNTGGVAPTTAVATTLSPIYVFPVNAGQRTFILEAQKAGTGQVHAYDAILTAIYIPFGPSGASEQP